MRERSWVRRSGAAVLGLGLAATTLNGCEKEKEEVEEALESKITGQVVDNRGQPVAGATVKLYNLLSNTNFVEGSDISSGVAYIDKAAILASNNTITTGQTREDGKFTLGAFPSAFLAVAVKEGCTAGFEGFDAETGVLSINTLIKPKLGSSVSFSIQTFVIACATPPEVGPEGNSPECPPFDPPVKQNVCEAVVCVDAGGTCVEDACVITCAIDACVAAGGTCVSGKCVLPACNAAACAALGGACTGDDCILPKCNAEACKDLGGTCVSDACVLPKCDASACTAAGGTCTADACKMPSCDMTKCALAKGTCNPAGDTCVIPPCFAAQAECIAKSGKCSADGSTCQIPACLAAEADCKAQKGICSTDGSTCEIPPCFAAEAACKAAHGICSADGATCRLPACSTDADCNAAQPGAICKNPGDVETSVCEPAPPGEIVPPPAATGWTSFQLTDVGGTVLADASEASQAVPSASIPADGTVRVAAAYSGAATVGYLFVQGGGHECPDSPPRSDYTKVDISGGKIVTSLGDFLELSLSRGFQRFQLTTSDVLGEGERSFVIDVAEPCARPASPFMATLTWDAGPGQPADLDLTVWNAAGDRVYVGSKQAAWGKLSHESKGPGPEVFEADDASQGPFTVKVVFFSGKPRAVEGKVRITRTVDGKDLDDTFVFTVNHPKDVAEIGVF
jgi:hypothetical protein